MLLRELIIEYRKQNKLSQRQFAKKCGNLSNGYISMIENDLNPATNKSITPSIEKIASLANGMDLTFDELMSKADDLRIDLSHVSSETVFFDESDKDFIKSHATNRANWIPVKEEVAAINSMAYNYGIQIMKLDGADNYVLSGQNGTYEITEEEIQGLLNTIQAGVVEKLMYLEKDKHIELLEDVNKYTRRDKQ